MKLKSIKLLLKNPRRALIILGKNSFLKLLPDEPYLKLLYRDRMKRPLNLANPQRYTEKLQWLKLHNRQDAYTQLVDKYAVRRHVAETIGEEYLIPLLGGPWTSFDDIDFDALPDQFVLKCTHDSGGLIVCRDKSKLDVAAARTKLEAALKRNYYWSSREWPYKNMQGRIIAEKYMEDSVTTELRDYKFFCFDGEPRALFIATDRYTPGEETKFDFFDMDFNHLDVRNGHPNAAVPPARPERFELMRELAAKLSAGFPHARIDLYEVDGQVYFGEITFFHWSGTTPFEPDEWDYTFGSWITLPEKTDA